MRIEHDEDDARDWRIAYYRPSIAHWTARGDVTHIPSGRKERFEIAWNDQSGIAAAKARIRAALAHTKEGE
jgi:hypothetical protein